MNRERELVRTIDSEGTPVKIYASDDLVEGMKQDGTLEQARNMAGLPGAVDKVCVMPDGHRGYGFPIGGVAAFDAREGIISPGSIGFDINCGVRLLKTDLSREDIRGREQRLANILYSKIPAGLGGGGLVDTSREELQQVLDRGVEWMVENGYGREEDLRNCEENGSLPGDHAKVPDKAKERGNGQIGSLGSGNHFLEVQVVDEIFDADTAAAYGLEEGQVVVMIHSGSRGLGHQTCTEYVRRFEKEYPDVADGLEDVDLIYAPLDEQPARDYRDAMYAAANYAWANRQGITHGVRKALKELFDADAELVYDVCHNIAKQETHRMGDEERELMIHRKGATRAFPAGREEVPETYRQVGQPVLIPGSMGARSYVLSGGERSLELSFGSAAHGAGRLKSRTQAKEEHSGKRLQKQLERDGVTVKARSVETIEEEAPDAYKDIDEVVRVSHKLGIGHRVAAMEPVVNIKG
jgi:tRNA-splicing ligase RtcB